MQIRNVGRIFWKAWVHGQWLECSQPLLCHLLHQYTVVSLSCHGSMSQAKESSKPKIYGERKNAISYPMGEKMRKRKRKKGKGAGRYGKGKRGRGVGRE